MMGKLLDTALIKRLKDDYGLPILVARMVVVKNETYDSCIHYLANTEENWLYHGHLDYRESPALTTLRKDSNETSSSI